MNNARGWMLVGYVVFLGCAGVCKEALISATNAVFGMLARRSLSLTDRRILSR